MRCSGKIVIVTGGAMGIGLAIVQGFLAEGANVVIADRAGAAEAAKAQGGAPNSVIGVPCDVSSQSDTEAMANAALETFGRIDVLVNNAGIYSSLKMTPFEDLTIDEWRRVLEVNVIGQAMATRAVVPAMRRQRGGSIVNVSSGTPFKGVPFLRDAVQGCSILAALRGEQGRRQRDDQGFGEGTWRRRHTGQCGSARIHVVRRCPRESPSAGRAPGNLTASTCPPTRSASGRHRGRSDLFCVAGLRFRHGANARRRWWRLLSLIWIGRTTSVRCSR